jgi:hypothetical protein
MVRNSQPRVCRGSRDKQRCFVAGFMRDFWDFYQRTCYRPWLLVVLIELLLATTTLPAWSAIVASDSASDIAYSSDPTGAWKGAGSTEGENPPGNDDGGIGFRPWDFRGGYHNPAQSPYGNLNHFIDGIDFTHRDANDLGSPAFGLTNAGFAPIDAYFGYTARATRSFDAPLEVGQTLSIDFDNPVPQPLDPFSVSGFLFRLNSGRGPVIDNAPIPGVVERFGVFTASNFNGGRWYTTDSVAFTDTEVAPTTTATGAIFIFSLTATDTYSMEFRRLSDQQLLYSRSGTLNHVGADPIDCLEITLYSNGSSATGSREFFFDNLRIEDDSVPVLGDYNHNAVVDAADYVVWRDSLNQSVPNGTGADGNDNGLIDSADYDIWKSHFGQSTVGAVAAAVPEAPTFFLVTVATVLLDVFWTRRR